MKYLIITISTVLLLAACKENNSKQIAPAVHADTMATHIVKKDFGNIVFASKKDLSCGMPLTAGLSDTVHYKEKVYGFCSPECKADFVKNAAVYVK